mmetsp:Transcript_15032/g.28607  ORF Transcript_15032/g.28607 Transcript_15032/m.28607 type:complete len:245 (+) Transcript_15032:329-1063(+)
MHYAHSGSISCTSVGSTSVASSRSSSSGTPKATSFDLPSEGFMLFIFSLKTGSTFSFQVFCSFSPCSFNLSPVCFAFSFACSYIAFTAGASFSSHSLPILSLTFFMYSPRVPIWSLLFALAFFSSAEAKVKSSLDFSEAGFITFSLRYIPVSLAMNSFFFSVIFSEATSSFLSVHSRAGAVASFTFSYIGANFAAALASASSNFFRFSSDICALAYVVAAAYADEAPDARALSPPERMPSDFAL